MSYKLNRLELETIIGFNHDTFVKINTQKIENKMWDELLFNRVLKAQPELKGDYDKLISSFKSHYSNYTQNRGLVSQRFADKIEVASVKELLFGSRSNLSEPKRVSFYERLYKREPQMLDMLHEHLKSAPYIPTTLFIVYSKALSALSPNQYPSGEVMDIMKKYKVRDTSQVQVKISLCLHLFEKNKELFDYLHEDMKDLFLKSAEAMNHWEEAWKSFPAEFSTGFKTQIPPMFTDKEEYTYNFALSEDYIVVTQKISSEKAKKFIVSFNQAMIKSLAQIGCCTQYTPGDPLYGITVKSDKIEDIEKMKKFCQKVTKAIPRILSECDLESKEIIIQLTTAIQSIEGDNTATNKM